MEYNLEFDDITELKGVIDIINRRSNVQCTKNTKTYTDNKSKDDVYIDSKNTRIIISDKNGNSLSIIDTVIKAIDLYRKQHDNDSVGVSMVKRRKSKT